MYAQCVYTRKMCVQQVSVCPLTVAHTVVATTWVRTPVSTTPLLRNSQQTHHSMTNWENTFGLPLCSFWFLSPRLGPPMCFSPIIRCMSQCFSVSRGILVVWFSMMPLCGIYFWVLVHREVVFPILWERLYSSSVTFHESVHLSSVSLESHVDLQWVAWILSHATRSWTFFAAFSLRLLSLCESSACTSRPCNSSFGQLRLSDVIGSKFHICNFDLGFPRTVPNVGILIRPKHFGELLLVFSRHKFCCPRRKNEFWQTTSMPS